MATFPSAPGLSSMSTTLRDASADCSSPVTISIDWLIYRTLNFRLRLTIIPRETTTELLNFTFYALFSTKSIIFR